MITPRRRRLLLRPQMTASSRCRAATVATARAAGGAAAVTVAVADTVATAADADAVASAGACPRARAAAVMSTNNHLEPSSGRTRTGKYISRSIWSPICCRRVATQSSFALKIARSANVIT